MRREAIPELWRHQAHALDLILAGDDVALATGTASGKSLPAIAGALHLLRREPMARALFVYPTKALAQDQLRRIAPLARELGLRAAVYDGDTPTSSRARIRREANLVLTNPDMLHAGILPMHAAWRPFLRALRLVFLDEMHVYGGVFGSQAAGVFRRLLRLAERAGSRPRLIAASATTRDPAWLLRRLTGRTAAVVHDDAAPAGERTLLMYAPPDPLDGGHGPGRRAISADLLARLAAAEVRTIAFSRSRAETEGLLRDARRRLEGLGGEPDRLDAYRGGYSPAERREIERRLFAGELVGVAATNALELGLDVGGLDAVVLNGFPGRVSSFWQQIGRAGRGGRPGLAAFVARSDPLELHLLRHPYLLLDADLEPVHLDPENPPILADQLRCAAYESPLEPRELTRFGEGALDLAERLDRAGELAYRAGRFHITGTETPAWSVGLRSAGGEGFRLLAGEEEIGTMDRWRALTQANAGAIYLHRGETFRVTELDLPERIARLERTPEEITTEPIIGSLIEMRAVRAEESAGEGVLALAPLKVRDEAIGYRVRSARDGSVLSTHPLAGEPIEYETVGLAIVFPPPEFGHDPSLAASAIHGAEHALLALAPLIAGCDPGDLGSTWTTEGSGTGLPTVFVYDRHPGGVGLAEALWGRREEWLRAARELLAECPCEDGCPRCLLSARCPQRNEGLSKPAARLALASLAGG